MIQSEYLDKKIINFSKSATGRRFAQSYDLVINDTGNSI